MIPNAVYDLRYYTGDNFIGERIDGYNGPFAILTLRAARALKKVNDDLESQGYRLKIIDAYRPQKAVNHKLSMRPAYPTISTGRSPCSPSPGSTASTLRIPAS
ncbi:M15 family metallopeptidase [Paenibacillus sp. p3-SID1389]|uniref:M15 family metallopeptidase n=1 Tax=unclassified Paenibacillus TaxID=185978 RepID=UPI0018DDA3D0